MRRDDLSEGGQRPCGSVRCLALVSGLCLLLFACAEAPPAAADLGQPPAELTGGPLDTPYEDAKAIVDDFVIGMDHNEVPNPDRINCKSAAGRTFPWCYAGHEGSDFLLSGGFTAMDAGSAYVVAAADGRVFEIEDGHYDRCHGDIMSGMVNCDGHEMKANRVVIDHADFAGASLRTEYLHLMSGSLLVKPGDTVRCGQRLARIGSSGRSSVPHLHLNVFAGGARRDPFAGPFSQPQTYFRRQPAEPGPLPQRACAP